MEQVAMAFPRMSQNNYLTLCEVNDETKKMYFQMKELSQNNYLTLCEVNLIKLKIFGN